MQNSKAETFIGERKKIQKIHPREIHETLPSSVSKKFQAKEKRKGANGERRGTRVTVFFFERVRTLVSAWFPRSAPCVCTRGPRKRAVENPPRGLVEWVRRNEGRPLIGDRQSVGRQPACHTVVCARVFLPSFSRRRVARTNISTKIFTFTSILFSPRSDFTEITRTFVHFVREILWKKYSASFKFQSNFRTFEILLIFKDIILWKERKYYFSKLWSFALSKQQKFYRMDFRWKYSKFLKTFVWIFDNPNGKRIFRVPILRRAWK